MLEALASLEPEFAADPASTCAIIVDNDSRDGSAEAIDRGIAERGWGPWARMVRASRNGGFSYGNNVGIHTIDAAAYVLLNSDTYVRPGFLPAVRRGLAEHPTAGVLGLRLEWPSEEPQVSTFRDPHPLSELLRGARTGLISRRLRRYEVAKPVPLEPTRAEWVSFAGTVIRRAAYALAGPMDEGYFMYFEDADYCRTVRERGMDVVYWPEARVVHLRGGTSPVKELSRMRRRRPSYYYRARSRYFSKFYGVHGLYAANVCWTAGYAVDLFRHVIGNRATSCCERETIDIWASALPPLASSEPA